MNALELAEFLDSHNAQIIRRLTGYQPKIGGVPIGPPVATLTTAIATVRANVEKSRLSRCW